MLTRSRNQAVRERGAHVQDIEKILKATNSTLNAALSGTRSQNDKVQKMFSRVHVSYHMDQTSVDPLFGAADGLSRGSDVTQMTHLTQLNFSFDILMRTPSAQSISASRLTSTLTGRM